MTSLVEANARVGKALGPVGPALVERLREMPDDGLPKPLKRRTNTAMDMIGNLRVFDEGDVAQWSRAVGRLAALLRDIHEGLDREVA